MILSLNDEDEMMREDNAFICTYALLKAARNYPSGDFSSYLNIWVEKGEKDQG